jgi:DNA-binding response OmpR family regulator
MNLSTKTILLADDDENDVFFMQQAMQSAGIVNPLQVVADGRQAIAYFQGVGNFANRAEFPLPYLMLLDLRLPHVPGLDVLKWVRQQTELTTIVVILTASKDDADVGEAYRMGAAAYLVKPSDLSKLVEMVKALKEFWLTQNTPPPKRHVG